MNKFIKNLLISLLIYNYIELNNEESYSTSPCSLREYTESSIHPGNMILVIFVTFNMTYPNVPKLSSNQYKLHFSSYSTPRTKVNVKLRQRISDSNITICNSMFFVSFSGVGSRNYTQIQVPPIGCYHLSHISWSSSTNIR